ncbi:MAG: 30S ribosomal protein S9 [Chlamydiota bacterium]|nr:30S ribosomal protein S9 [Chlamydiota bacterium]
MTEKIETFYGTGRRKTAIAKVWINRGSGKIQVNGKTAEGYFARPTLEKIIRKPLDITQRESQYDIKAQVLGGGLSGQAQALSLGLSRALVISDPTLHKKLRDEGFLTRDPRAKERKKYGQKGARKRFQFSKR